MKGGTLVFVKKPLCLACQNGVNKMKLMPGDELVYVGFSGNVCVFDFNGARLVSPSHYIPSEIDCPMMEA